MHNCDVKMVNKRLQQHRRRLDTLITVVFLRLSVINDQPSDDIFVDCKKIYMHVRRLACRKIKSRFFFSSRADIYFAFSTIEIG